MIFCFNFLCLFFPVCDNLICVFTITKDNSCLMFFFLSFPQDPWFLAACHAFISSTLEPVCPEW